MASSLQSSTLPILGKRFLTHIIPPAASTLLIRRAAHVSIYDKNLEDHVRPSVVKDEVIQVQSEKYWAPHPQTGVFGPATDHNPTGEGKESGLHSSPQESVLEQKAFFRPQEDLEKPSHP